MSEEEEEPTVKTDGCSRSPPQTAAFEVAQGRRLKRNHSFPRLTYAHFLSSKILWPYLARGDRRPCPWRHYLLHCVQNPGALQCPSLARAAHGINSRS